jgi:ribulose 1,5-bisphosphate synthetase/thiazole synthase
MSAHHSSSKQSSSSSSSNRQQSSDALSPGEEVDVVVIGAGIGGLSCAALLAYYGFKASSHYEFEL